MTTRILLLLGLLLGGCAQANDNPWKPWPEGMVDFTLGCQCDPYQPAHCTHGLTDLCADIDQVGTVWMLPDGRYACGPWPQPEYRAPEEPACGAEFQGRAIFVSSATGVDGARCGADERYPCHTMAGVFSEIRRIRTEPFCVLLADGVYHEALGPTTCRISDQGIRCPPHEDVDATRNEHDAAP